MVGIELLSMTVEPEMSNQFITFMRWADQKRKLGVRANADTPTDAHTAIEFGAEGIGLCRTEHMFFGEGRIDAVREMIMASSEQERRSALGESMRKLLTRFSHCANNR